MTINAKSKKEAFNKARELFSSDLKDIDINNKEMLVKVRNGKI